MMTSLKIFTKTIEVTHWLFLYYIIQSEKHIEFLLPVFFSPHSTANRKKKKKKQNSNDIGFKIIEKLCLSG